MVEDLGSGSKFGASRRPIQTTELQLFSESEGQKSLLIYGGTSYVDVLRGLVSACC